MNRTREEDASSVTVVKNKCHCRQNWGLAPRQPSPSESRPISNYCFEMEKHRMGLFFVPFLRTWRLGT